MSKAEEDIKLTRRIEDKAVNTVEDMMSTFAFNVGSMLKGNDTDIATIRLEIEKALNEAGYDDAIGDVLNNDYQQLINQSHDLYKDITGEDKIILTDETTEQPKES